MYTTKRTLQASDLAALSTSLTVAGGATISIGMATLLWPDATVTTLTLLFGLAVLVAGLGHVAAGRALRTCFVASGWLLGSGVISILAAATALLWPGLAVGHLATVLSCSLFAHGGGLGIAGWRLRQQSNVLRRRARVRTAVIDLEARSERTIV